MCKEKGKKNSKSNLTLTQWLVSLKLEHKERKKLRIESQMGRADCRCMILSFFEDKKKSYVAAHSPLLPFSSK